MTCCLSILLLSNITAKDGISLLYHTNVFFLFDA
uniref:Uncharacterized protein n=1 Tax=Anguilla anguilla TaxID=7936 RepID=A0A0E9RXJ1_ANGAN